MGNAAAQKIETPPESNIVEINPGALVKFDTTEHVIRDAEKLLTFEVTDPKSRKKAGIHRKKVNALISTVDRKRIDLKKDAVAVIEQEGQVILGRLGKVKTHLSDKITGFDSIEATAKAEKMAAEKKRTDAIAEELADLKSLCAGGLQYGLSSDVILEHLEAVVTITPNEHAYQEFASNAWDIIREAIPQVQGAYERAVQFEADQATQADLEAKNKAEADRLAKIAQEQEKADAAAKAKRDAEAAKIAADRKALEAEKAKAAADQKAREEAEKKRLADLEKREQTAAWGEWAATLERQWIDEAYQVNSQMDLEKLTLYNLAWDEAIETNYEFDRTRAAKYSSDWSEAHFFNVQLDLGQAMADDIEAARIEALRPDREKLTAFAMDIATLNLPELATPEGQRLGKIVDQLLRDVVDVIHEETEVM
ncbi:MAG: hypothetical protein JEZ12_28015 [Desulfobacterium sp.]|nr:hypothetical protein [Desulfobacterium sp.]